MKNNYKTSILSYINSIGIPVAGVSGDGRTHSRIVCLFPYYTGKENSGNLSMYAHGKDYHIIVNNYLLKISDYIKKIVPSVVTKIHVDKGIGDDKLEAFRAGLGFFGKNSLLINEKYGSYFFIGYVETDLILSPDLPTQKNCIGCGRCEKACPGNAIQNGKVFVEKCASYISQKKGDLSAAEKSILKKCGLVWGCDICQSVCPHNCSIPITPIADFQIIYSTSVSEIPETNKKFLEMYGERAFSWRGKSVLIRNLEIISGCNLTITE